jgi:4-carboxymuconolactone decarboxylase
MTRLVPLDKDTLFPDARTVWDKIAGKRGDVRGPYQILMHAPALAEKVADLGELLRFTSTLPGKERELAILATARALGAAFEWVMHEPFARREGVPPQTIEVIRSVGSLDALEPRERIIVELVRTLVDSRVIPDDVYARALAELGTTLLVELVTLVGFYMMIALLLSGFEVDLPDGAGQPF